MLPKTGPLQDLFRFDTAGKTNKLDTTWLGRGVQACLGGQRLEEAEGGPHEGGAAGRAHRRRVAGRNHHTHRLHQQRRAEANLHVWRQHQNPHSRAAMQRSIHPCRAHSAGHNPFGDIFSCSFCLSGLIQYHRGKAMFEGTIGPGARRFLPKRLPAGTL